MKFTAAGDMIIQKRVPRDYGGFAELAPFIAQGDARFFNLETTLNREGEACAAQLSGGTYLRADPRILEDIKPFGFNMTSANNNHAFDFSYEGFQGTLDALNESGMVHAGLGNNLAEAAAPRYLQTKNGCVALIAVNTNFDESMLAGQQSARVPGRPGINGLRIESHIELPEQELALIRSIADETGINASKEITRREGYYPFLKDDEAELGAMKFKQGEKPRYVMQINKADMARVEKAIFEAQLQADYIIVSIHSHQIAGDKKENPAEFLKEFAHRCIDLGAHAIVGHGPHLLRPIEVYKDCPIFYSLGDFVLQLYDLELAPEEFYNKHGLTSEATVHELLKKRSQNFTVGLMSDWRMYHTVVPYWETDGTRLTKIKLMPVEMVMDGNKAERGLPRKCSDPKLREYLADMCVPYGTTITAEADGTYSCTW